MVPKHLIRTQRNRNICLTHKLIEVYGHPDRDLALEIGGGFPSLGKQKPTGPWEGDESRGQPKSDDPESFPNAGVKRGEKKPSWMLDEVTERVLELILEDIEKGRLDEIGFADLKVSPLKAFGIVQKGKARQLVDARCRNICSAHP